MAKDLKPGDVVSHLAKKVPFYVKQMILGGLIGDSTIRRPSDTTRGFDCTHSVSQSEYFEWKKNIFGDFVKETTMAIGGFAGSQPTRRMHSIITPEISELILKNCEVNGRKKITHQWIDQMYPLAIAILYMDDGSINQSPGQRPRPVIHLCSYSMDEARILQEIQPFLEK
jgi:recombination protein RecA